MSFQHQPQVPLSKRQMEDFDIIKKVKLPKMLTGNIYIFGRIGCLAEDTIVQVFENDKVVFRKIKDLDSEFYMPSYNFEKYRLEIKKSYKIKSNITSGVKITFADGTYVISSKKHKFFKTNGEIVIVSDLNVGDMLLKKVG